LEVMEKKIRVCGGSEWSEPSNSTQNRAPDKREPLVCEPSQFTLGVNNHGTVKSPLWNVSVKTFPFLSDNPPYSIIDEGTLSMT
jgi:hypothetical protein